MNIENKKLRNIEAVIPQNKPADPSGTGAESAGAAHRGSGIEVASGKPRGISKPLFVITGVARCMGLVSCVVPYDSQGGGSVTVSSYSPGYRVQTLPGGYRSEVISGNTYYYHDGYYYNQGSGGYVVVDAPRNSRYQSDYSRRHRTYSSNRDDQESSNRHDQRYERGEILTRLPDKHQVVNHRGNTYYQVEDRYYRRQGETYVISTKPY